MVHLKIEQLNIILDSIKMLNAQMERGELLSLVLTRSMDVVSAEAGTLWLVQEESNSLRPVEVQGIEKELMDHLSLHNGEGFAGQVVKSNKPMLVKDVHLEPGWASRFDEETGFKTKSILCIPLTTENKTIGCLELVNKLGGHSFKPEDLDMVYYFAGYAAAALENSRLYSENQDLLESTIYVLSSALDAREPYAKRHSENVTNYALLIGRYLGLSQEDLHTLKWTALLHDVGKIGVSDNILLSPGSLSKEEWVYIKKHPEIGYNILKELKPVKFAKKISIGVLNHHEYYNGKGYPAGLQRDEIPYFSRIISVADAYDAITSERPYRKRASTTDAIEEIKRCSGTQFDPGIVEVFLEAIKKQ